MLPITQITKKNYSKEMPINQVKDTQHSTKTNIFSKNYEKLSIEFDLKEPDLRMLFLTLTTIGKNKSHFPFSLSSCVMLSKNPIIIKKHSLTAKDIQTTRTSFKNLWWLLIHLQLYIFDCFIIQRVDCLPPFYMICYVMSHSTNSTEIFNLQINLLENVNCFVEV